MVCNDIRTVIKRRLAPLLLVGAAAQCLLGSDCGPLPPAPETGRLDVSEMVATMSVRADGRALNVTVRLTDVSGDGLTLTDGDALTASIGGEVRALTPENPYSGPYSTQFQAPQSAGDVAIAFTRPSRKGAPLSTVHVAAPFEITNMMPRSVRNGDPLAWKFSRPIVGDDGTPQAHFEGSCLETAVGNDNRANITTLHPDGDNLATIHVLRLVFNTLPAATGNGGVLDGPCSATMSAELETMGHLDGAFTATSFSHVASSLRSDQRRSFTVTVSN